jgi:hypothetical protein
MNGNAKGSAGPGEERMQEVTDGGVCYDRSGIAGMFTCIFGFR